MEIKDLEMKYLKESVELAVEEYRQEARKCKALIPSNFKDELKEMITALFEHKCGKVAVVNGRVVGYIAFWGPLDGFHGNVKGVFSPLGGSAFGGVNREKTASMLYSAVSEDLVDKEVCSFALSRYAHDEEVGKSFVLNGFGIRCADAIMRLSERHIIENLDSDLQFVELIGEDKKQIESLRRGLVRHLSQAPAFFPTHIESFNEWLYKDNIRVFVAKKGNELAGYISLDEEAETFITEQESVYNICGTYVAAAYRGKKIAQQLLEYVCQLCEKEGKKYLGVDCETLNPTALRFWGKYFDTYTYSYIRRIDERVVGYRQYLDQIWKDETKE